MRRESLIALLTLAAAVLLIYARSLPTWFLADDFFTLEAADPSPPWSRFLLPQYVFLPQRYEAVNLHGRPFLLATFGLQRLWTGLEPLPLRAFNLAALTAASWLLWRLIRSLPGSSFLPALWCALAFAAHPEHIDGVTWIAGRGAVLSTALVLAALWAWNGGRKHLAVGAFVLGLGVYELSVMLPLLLLCLWGRAVLRERSWWAMVAIGSSWAVLQVGFLSAAPRFGWRAASPIHALRHLVQLLCPFFDSPRFAFYNESAKAFVRERVEFFAPLALVLLVALALVIFRYRRAAALRRRGRLLLATAVALAPAVAYGHFSPRTSFLASAFLVASLLPTSRHGRRLLGAWTLALAWSTWDENGWWRRGGELSRESVQRAARGEDFTPPVDLGRMVPLFPGPETLETALRLFPAGPP